MQKNRRLQLGHVKRALLFVWTSSKKWTVGNVIIIFLKGFLPLVLLWLIKFLIDEVSILMSTPIAQRSIFPLVWVLVIACFVFVVNSLVSSIGTLVREKQSYLLNDYIYALIHKRTATMKYAYFEDANFQNIFHRAINESSYRPSRIFFGVTSLIQLAITLLLLGGVLVTLHWSVLLVLLVISIPVVYIRVAHSRKLFNLKKEQTEEERKVYYYNRVLTGKEYAKELRAFNLADVFHQWYQNTLEVLRLKQFDVLVQKTKIEILVQLFSAVVVFSIYALIAYRAVEGTIDQGMMVVYFLALQRGYSFLFDFINRLSTFLDDGLYISNLFEFLDFEIERHCGNRVALFPDKIAAGVSIENVSFNYVHSQRPVFKNINLFIKAGETIALVGANGVGKTTLVKLLSGLYEPTAGSIKVDDVCLSDISQTSLAKGISVIFQDYMLYNATAMDNIWLGNINSEKNMSDIESAAGKSGIHTVLSALPNGYQTTLGNLFKGSEQLSVGEWQRVALARSFYNNAQLVILDEPTSSMDAITEARLIKHFKSITEGRTAVIVSHRLATISLADKIVVLDTNGIAEVGSYDELVNKKGAFKEIVDSISLNVKS